jgi:hypothetical protein
MDDGVLKIDFETRWTRQQRLLESRPKELKFGCAAHSPSQWWGFKTLGRNLFK